MGETVVGRGQNKVQGPVVTGTNNAALATDYINNINSRLAGQGVNVVDTTKISASDAWIKSLSPTQTGELAAVFKKMGKTVKDTKTLATLLTDYPEVTTAKDYITGYNTLVSMLIPGTGGTGNVPTQTITQYSDDYLKKVADNIGQDFLDRKLSSAEVDKIMPKLRELVNKGTTTTSKRVGGKTVVSTTPGFTTADAEKVVQTELRLGASQDLERKQYLDFADFMSKNMAGM